MPRAIPTVPRAALSVFAAISIAACASSAPAPASTPAPVTSAPVTPAPVRAVPASPVDAGDLVALRVGGDPATRRIQLVDAASGALEADMPDGVIDRDAGLVYVTTSEPGATRVSALELHSGRQVRSTMVQGTVALPTIGVDAMPVGLSGDGRTLVLEVRPGLLGKSGPAPVDGVIRSRFTVLAADLEHQPRAVELDGRFSFDALSPNGRTLYLVEHVPADSPTGYQVRAYDLVAGKLLDGVIVDKTAGSLLMQGTPVTQVDSSDGGWIYTLYRNQANGPFVHALNAADGWALCLFPSRRPAQADEERAAAGWDLVMSPDGDVLYAANGALGMVTRVDLLSLGDTRTVQLEDTAPTAATDSARGAAVSTDGATLYVAAGSEVLSVKASTLRVAGRMAGTPDIAALAARTAGDLYASSRAGALSVIGAHGVAATLPLGAGPARILWVEARR